MKVLFVTRGWPSKDNPMSGNYEAVQARALAKRGIEVTVAYLKKKSVSHIFGSRKIGHKKDDGITVLSRMVVVSELPGVKTTRYGRLDSWLCQRAFLDLYEYYRKQKGDADIIHAHLIVHAFNCKKALEKYHIPFVITEHWSKMNYTILEAGLTKLGEGYQLADRVVCVSSALADSLKQKFGLECMVINNMVSNDFFNQNVDLRKAPSSRDIVKFVSVGSIEVRKGYDLIIKGLQKSKFCYKCQLSIIGSGPDEESIRKLISGSGLQDQVFLLGRKPPEEVSAQIAASDCFALTSRRETFGIVYIEAMAMGKPVIATICGGPECFVNESNGVLIPAEDVDAAADAIDYMVEHLDQYDGAAIREYCYENFSEERIAQKIIALYNEVLEERKKHN